MRTRPIIGLRKLEQTTFMALHALTAACYRLWLKLTASDWSPAQPIPHEIETKNL